MATESSTYKAACPVCEADVTLPPDALAGEIVSCNDCGAELEIESVAPASLIEAPEVAEDWGE